MVRRALAAVVVAGCGRLSFDVASDVASEDAGDDAAGVQVDAATLDATSPGAATFYLAHHAGSGMNELFSVDLPSGQLTLLGSVTGGAIEGLAYWDESTLYATAGNELWTISISPLNVTTAMSMVGAFGSLERDGAELVGVDDTNDGVGRFMPETPGGTIPLLVLDTDANGADVVRVNGSWYWWSNTDEQLFDITTIVTPIGTPNPAAPYIAGMVVDDSNQVWAYSPDTDGLHSIDIATGAIGPERTLCVSCPQSYPLSDGDMTRSP